MADMNAVVARQGPCVPLADLQACPCSLPVLCMSVPAESDAAILMDTTASHCCTELRVGTNPLNT